MNKRNRAKGLLFLLSVLVMVTVLSGCSKEEEPDTTVHVLALGSPFTTNVNGNRNLFLKTEMTIEIISLKDFEEIQTRVHEVENIILDELRLLTEDQVYDATIQETLRPQLVEKLKAGLELQISNVYFSTFIAT